MVKSGAYRPRRFRSGQQLLWLQVFVERPHKWSIGDSNPWPQQCECCALPTALMPLVEYEVFFASDIIARLVKNTSYFFPFCRKILTGRTECRTSFRMYFFFNILLNKGFHVHCKSPFIQSFQSTQRYSFLKWSAGA